MKHRKLRIAWSVAWGVAAVLLIAWWVLSRFYYSAFVGPTPGGGGFDVISVYSQLTGTLVFHRPTKWYLGSMPLEGASRLPLDLEEYRGSGFLVSLNSQYVDLKAPFWFLAITAGLLVGVPWIRWSNRFSLRTLLVATTLAAVVLGLIGWAAK